MSHAYNFFLEFIYFVFISKIKRKSTFCILILLENLKKNLIKLLLPNDQVGKNLMKSYHKNVNFYIEDYLVLFGMRS